MECAAHARNPKGCAAENSLRSPDLQDYENARLITVVPLLELGILHSVRESFTADADALEHAVASQLAEHERGVHGAALLHLVGNETAHEVRLRVAQVGHQLVQLFPVQGGDSLEAAAFLLPSLATS